MDLAGREVKHCKALPEPMHIGAFGKWLHGWEEKCCFKDRRCCPAKQQPAEKQPIEVINSTQQLEAELLYTPSETETH
jgi:hypothetical protein